MSYDKNTWQTGDVITASKLNNIESGVKGVNMSYDKTTWQTGDVITATKLNNIEDGIANASGSSDFTTANVTLTGSSTSMELPLVYEDAGGAGIICPARTYEAGTYEIVLYKGMTIVEITAEITVEGNIEQLDDGIYQITGDCTITH